MKASYFAGAGAGAGASPGFAVSPALPPVHPAFPEQVLPSQEQAG
jgi:hypothetical protein